MQALFEKLSCLGLTDKAKGCTIKAHENKLICFVVPLVVLLFIHSLACSLAHMPSGIRAVKPDKSNLFFCSHDTILCL